MTLGTAAPRVTSTVQPRRLRVTPTALMTDWFTLCDDLWHADSVTDLTAVIRAALKVAAVKGDGYALLTCLRYISGETFTAPVVQYFGHDGGSLHGHDGASFDGTLCLPMPLVDANGSLTFSYSSGAADVKRTLEGVLYGFTMWQELDLQNNAYVMPAIKTAATGTGMKNLVLLGKLK